MRRTSFASMTCSIARSLELFGDWWTLLIIREAFFGSRKFGEFHEHLGIATNTLTDRLAKLVEAGIFKIGEQAPNGRVLEYRLTEKGKDLYPIMVAMMQWGDKYAAGQDGPPLRLIEKASGEEIGAIEVRAQSGRILKAHDVVVTEGPGASEQDKLRLRSASPAK